MLRCGASSGPGRQSVSSIQNRQVIVHQASASSEIARPLRPLRRHRRRRVGHRPRHRHCAQGTSPSRCGPAGRTSRTPSMRPARMRPISQASRFPTASPPPLISPPRCRVPKPCSWSRRRRRCARCPRAMRPHLKPGAAIAICCKGHRTRHGTSAFRGRRRGTARPSDGRHFGADLCPGDGARPSDGCDRRVPLQLRPPSRTGLRPGGAAGGVRCPAAVSALTCRTILSASKWAVAVKNVIAIACGMMSGAGFAENTRAALIARGHRRDETTGRGPWRPARDGDGAGGRGRI